METLDFLIERKILKIGNRLSNTRDKDLNQYGLTPIQSEALLFYASNNGSPILDLKEWLDISHQAARSLVERLKLKGLLRMEISIEDGRYRKIYITKQGEEICASLKKQGGNVGQKLLSQLSQQEKGELLALLLKISE